MLSRKPVRRNLIIDIGTGNSGFVKTLKNRFPKSRVLGIDSDQNSNARIKLSMGKFFQRLKKPERIAEIWLNHIDIHTEVGFREFQVLAKSVLPGTRLFLTIRAINQEKAMRSLETAGFEIKSNKAFQKGMIASKATAEFEEGAKRGKVLMKPLRIFAIKK